MKQALLLTAVWAAALVTACDDESGSTSPDSGAANDVASDTTDSGGSAERTLQSCTTDIADDVPAFFRTYFRCVTITRDGDDVVIQTQDLPPHRSYYYGEGHPNFEAFDTSRGAEYRANPNAIAEQAIRISIPVTPVARGGPVDEGRVDGQVGTDPAEYPPGAVGVALDGVALFNALAAPGQDIAEERFTFDSYNAHPTENGTYHYHTASPGPLEVLQALGLIADPTPGAAEIEIYGILCDGTVVLGCTELDGSSPVDADLDAQNGHTHDLVDTAGAVLLAARYHTHVCPDRFTAHPYTPEIQHYDSCTR